MAERFDPYHKWLGIPPKDQPPNHYRLLGLELFETDPDVIDNAADGRMAQVKGFQLGKHTRLSQRLLNEIATAKVTLLNPEKRAIYDAGLREQGLGTPGAADASLPCVVAVTPAPPASHLRKPARQTTWLLAILAALGLAAATVWALLGDRNSRMEAELTAPAQVQAPTKPEEITAAPIPSRPRGEKEPRVLPLPEVAKMFGLQPPDWQVVDGALVGRVGDSATDTGQRPGQWLSVHPVRASAVRFGFSMLAPRDHQIVIVIDGSKCRFSRGGWRNTGTLIERLQGDKITQRPGPTIERPEQWNRLEASLADGIVSLLYNGDTVWQEPIAAQADGKHTIRVGFGSDNQAIHVRDFVFEHQ